MEKEINFQQLGMGIASITFGVALSIFIYAAASGLLSSAQAILLYITSFLLMLRFWWRYTELFIQFLPSRSFWQFLFDFAISFFGILAVMFIGNIQLWALLGAAAMTASIIRCRLSWKHDKTKHELKRTVSGAVLMLAIFSVVYALAPVINNLYIAGTVFMVVLLFVVSTSFKRQ
ncbi:MAG: hypothetical protein J4473_03190 [Candidatus Aenigmarchaeota archaeon]|nr:hypothetical protein [Candidatus Aenigmarchaeota archaeon]